MNTLQQIQDSLSHSKDTLFNKYGIKEMAIFGSYSRHEQVENSDVDIMVEFLGPVGIEFIDLADELETILKQKVDLVSKRGIKPKYFEVIKNELTYV